MENQGNAASIKIKNAKTINSVILERDKNRKFLVLSMYLAYG